MKWLFEAHLNDGTVIQQNPQDESEITPGKNCFYDVLQRIDDVQVFGLFSNEVSTTYVVDLRDGHFEVGGAPFYVQDPSVTVSDSKFRLIYFRTVRRHFNVGVDEGMEEIGCDILFNIGWQMTVDGQNHQRVITVF